MGFPLGYTEIYLPNIFLHTLSILGLIRNLISYLFHFLGLSDFLEPEFLVLTQTQTPRPVPDSLPPPPSTILIRELLPLVNLESMADPPESCVICLQELERGDEIRWLRNCRHVFHSGCLDRWMDCDQKTCPLCRTQFVPEDDRMKEEFNQRMYAAEFLHGHNIAQT